jgi:hypothetical protein
MRLIPNLLQRHEDVELRALQPGDRFRMFDTPGCPEQIVIARRAPSLDLSRGDLDARAALFNVVFTLQRVDDAGMNPYEISLDAFTTVTRTRRAHQ